MTKYSGHDQYIDPATGILKIASAFTDEAALEQTEAAYVATRSFQLAQRPWQGNFDLAHLQAIHRHLFGDVYEWAGELRTVDISKGGNMFAHHAHIASAATPVFQKLEAVAACSGGVTRHGKAVTNNLCGTTSQVAASLRTCRTLSSGYPRVVAIFGFRSGVCLAH